MQDNDTLEGAPPVEISDLIKKAWLAVYTRAPKPDDLASARTFLERQTAELGTRKAAAAELIRVLFNTNEFLYVD